MNHLGILASRGTGADLEIDTQDHASASASERDGRGLMQSMPCQSRERDL